MKIFNITLFLLAFSLTCIAQDPIEAFNAVIDNYNLEYTSTDDPKEQAAINAKYEVLLKKADQDLEAAFEAEFEKALGDLLEEEKSFAVEEVENGFEEDFEEEFEETSEDKEFSDWMIKYVNRKTDLNKLNLSKASSAEEKKYTLKDIAKELFIFEIPGRGLKQDYVDIIWLNLN